MVTTPPFHQVEDPVLLEPEFSTQLMGGYDTSQVFSRDFLEPHILPSLPDWEPIIPTSSSPVAEPVACPKSPSGATYDLPGLPQDVEDHLFTRTLLAPSYEHVVTKEDPEESLKRHMSELQLLLGGAKKELKEAYMHAVRTDEEYTATVAEHEKGLSRWKAAAAISISPQAWHDLVPSQIARDEKGVKKERISKEAFGGNLLAFD